MTRYKPEHLAYDDAELDDLLTRAMTGIGAKLDVGFDPAVGLADVYSRNQADAPAPAGQTRHAPWNSLGTTWRSW